MAVSRCRSLCSIWGLLRRLSKFGSHKEDVWSLLAWQPAALLPEYPGPSPQKHLLRSFWCASLGRTPARTPVARPSFWPNRSNVCHRAVLQVARPWLTGRSHPANSPPRGPRSLSFSDNAPALDFPAMLYHPGPMAISNPFLMDSTATIPFMVPGNMITTSTTSWSRTPKSSR